MPQDAVRSPSELTIIATSRGPVQILRQKMRGLRRGSVGTGFWVARGKGRVGGSRGPPRQEAIRRSALLPSSKPPGWLTKAASDVERQLQPASAERPDP